MLNQYPTNFNQTFGQNNEPFDPDSMDQSISNNMPYSMNNSLPQPMAGNLTEDNLYPFNSPLNNQRPVNFSKGGRVKKQNNPLPSLAEIIRQQGHGDDSILAHINPLEALMLKQMGGSGSINKKTGLPQFGFKRALRKVRNVVGGVGGSILGNMLLPGIGGMVGGALGQGVQNKSRGKSLTNGILKGGAIGATLPTLAGLMGSGANAMGMTDSSKMFTDYGSKNAILPSLGLGNKGSISGINAGESNLTNPLVEQINPATADKDEGFLSSLSTNSKNFLSKPKNLLTLASVAGSMANKPKKEKSPETLAKEQKRYQQAMALTPAERSALEADRLAERQMERRLARNQYLPEELFETKPIYRRTNTPEEYKKTGKWLDYYDNADFQGVPLRMKKGGLTPGIIIEERQIESPHGMGMFLQGMTKGQDDEIPASLSDGEYVIPADVVAHAGDGNSIAGGKQFDKFIENIRRSKGAKLKLPPKAKSLINYMR